MPYNKHGFPYITLQPIPTEREFLVGAFICATSYGIIICLFSQCIGTLLNPVNQRRRGIKPLVAHTVAMFLVVTISTALYLDVPFIVHIFDSHSGGFNSVSGFLDYSDLLKLGTTSTLLFLFNQGLADGLLLYRCYIIYAMNFWAIAFPCLMYFISLATGVIFIILLLQDLPPGTVDFGIAYFSVALLLNVLLTVMVVIRLILHSRNIHSAIGAPAGASGVYKTAITMLIESCALYAICCLPVIGLWMTINTTLSISFPILSGAQVIAPFLITLRVAKGRALTNDAIASGSISSIQFRSQGRSAGGDDPPPDEFPTSPSDAHGDSPGEDSVGAENRIDEVPL